MTQRLYKFDNLKAILIFLVVFGHFLELVKGYKLLYLIIYSFHMPFFMFISGYFARFNAKNIVYKLGYPYIIFQILYTCLYIYVLHVQKLTFTLVKPIWILWYMFALIVYYLLIPIFEAVSYRKRPYVVLFTIIISLVSGYDNKLSYDFAAARICSFLPFFVTGYYMSESRIKINSTRLKKTITFIFAVIFIIILSKILSTGIITRPMIYGSCSYALAKYNLPIKLMITLVAYIWIALGLVLVQEKKTPFSSIGQYTMPIFLLHGFVVRLVGMYCKAAGISLPFYMAFIFSILLILILGNKYSDNIFNMIFTIKKTKRGKLCQRKN